MNHQNDQEIVRRLLSEKGRWAVVGLSMNTLRPAFSVARFLQRDLAMEIIPVNPHGDEVHGAKGYRTLADIPAKVDVVDCFVNSQRVGQVVDQAIEIGAKAVWLQLGVIDEAAAARASAAGLDVVMDTCPAIEAPRLGIA
ncbi:COA binding protein [Renibacterium salmoninarum ATCC 33209]|uniref:COA binding protein n=1 Tax=Renibacterium salmoninarum (strain ATCC 33209 / DSM 20767 / JCM 11484 / NBRC 15589 / NCIMB 2235) TaxID=288705 RepID=A9WV71_RENSM|nr:CoA-binding protein [Renibacterium salmoninarum]ABY25092.1 COA binding protein [Renibacterium salmoninarum ATCC 33209]